MTTDDLVLVRTLSLAAVVMNTPFALTQWEFMATAADCKYIWCSNFAEAAERASLGYVVFFILCLVVWGVAAGFATIKEGK